MMIPSTLEFKSTILLQATMKPTTTVHTKAHTLGMTVPETTEFMLPTPSNLS